MRTPEEMAKVWFRDYVPGAIPSMDEADLAALLAAWRDECVATSKPEAPAGEEWRDKIKAEQLIQQMRIENNAAERESLQGDGWLTDHSSAVRELNAELLTLLDRAPLAESAKP